MLRPYTRTTVFCPDYTRQERENLVTPVSAQVALYAQVRVVAEMPPESLRWTSWDKASAAAITPQSWDCYQQVLRTAPIGFTIAVPPPGQVRAAVQASDGLPAGERAPLTRPGNARPAPPGGGGAGRDPGQAGHGVPHLRDAWDEDYPALMLLNAVTCNGTCLRSFSTCRRLSCYAIADDARTCPVSSGDEFSKVGRARGGSRPTLRACRTALYRRRAGWPAARWPST